MCFQKQKLIKAKIMNTATPTPAPAPQLAIITVPLQEWNETKAMIKSLSDAVASMTQKEEKELLTPKEVCEILKIGRTTFQRYLSNGDLIPVKVNRKKYSKILIRRSDITSLIENPELL